MDVDEAALNRVIEALCVAVRSQDDRSYNRYKIPRAALKKALPQKICSKFNV